MENERESPCDKSDVQGQKREREGVGRSGVYATPRGIHVFNIRQPHAGCSNSAGQW